MAWKWDTVLVQSGWKIEEDDFYIWDGEERRMARGPRVPGMHGVERFVCLCVVLLRRGTNRLDSGPLVHTLDPYRSFPPQPSVGKLGLQGVRLLDLDSQNPSPQSYHRFSVIILPRLSIVTTRPATSIPSLHHAPRCRLPSRNIRPRVPISVHRQILRPFQPVSLCGSR